MSSSASSFTRECPCRGVVSSHRRTLDARVYCPVCVSVALARSLDRHEQALRKRNAAKEECARQLLSLKREKTLSELEFESQTLRERLAFLRHECGSLAVQVTARVVENDERRARQEQKRNVGLAIDQLNRLQGALCDTESGALLQALVSSNHQVKILRFRWALQVFRMHRLDVDDPQETDQQATRIRHRVARGIGKIGGLPLPHAGAELYGVLPPQELQSVLRLVASLISTVARCLGIVLPHPILLQPNGPKGDIVDTVPRQKEPVESDQGTSVTTERRAQSVASSTTSLMSLMDATSALGRSAKKALKRATGQQALQNAAHTAIPPSMEASLVSQRLRHATAAVLAEDQSASPSLYELSHKHVNDESFAIGLQLLQNNAVALCIHAGVPVANLWPAQAILLNLYALSAFCQEQVDSHMH